MSAQEPTPDTKGYAVVTGCGSGLGRALAVELASRQFTIALVDCNAEAVAQTLSLVEESGGRGSIHVMDVSAPSAWQTLHEQLRQAWPRLDLLVNNAGVAGAGEVGLFPLADWRWLLEINLLGVIYGCSTFVDWLKQNPGKGAILNIASAAAFASLPSMGAYNVAKAGVVALSETLFAELRKDRVHVSVICPDFFRTNLLDEGRFVERDQKKFALDAMRRSKLNSRFVALAALRSVSRRRLHVILPFKARMLWRLKRLFPGTFHRIVARSYARGIPRTQ